jgi:hypothetical protein
MPTAPPLDPRRYQDLVDRLRFLLRGTEHTPGYLPEWNDQTDDAGMALVRTYARLMELVLQRLGKVPDRNLMAFLDFAGVSKMPPGAARGPVAFFLQPGAAGGTVPAGTRVATVQTSTQPAVVYEVQENFYLNPAAVVEGYTLEPGRDRYANRTPALTGQVAAVFAPFEGDTDMEHALYVGDPTLPASARPFKLRLHMAIVAGHLMPPWSDPRKWRNRLDDPFDLCNELIFNMEWAKSTGSGWEVLPRPRFSGGDYAWPGVTLTFRNMSSFGQAGLSGLGLSTALTGRWLRGRMTKPFRDSFPPVRAVGLEVVQDGGVAPDLAFAGSAPADLSTSFLPFGDAPKGGETLALSSTEALGFASAQPSGMVALDIPVDTGDVKWQWTAWNLASRSGAQTLPDGLDDDAAITVSAKVDDTARLGANGRISLVVAEPLRFPFALKVAMTGGAYPRVPLLRQLRVTGQVGPEGATHTTVPTRLYWYSPATAAWTEIKPAQPYHPFGLTPEVGAELVAFFDQREKPRITTSMHPVSETDLRVFGFVNGKPAGFHDEAWGDNPVPITTSARLEALPVSSTTLHLDVTIAATATVEWEYLSATGWKLLGRSSVSQPATGGALRIKEAMPQTADPFVDTTYALTRPGHVAFRRPLDATEGKVNGQAGYWVRVRLAGGSYGPAAQYVTTGGDKPGFELAQGTGGATAPVVKRLTLRYNTGQPTPLAALYNDFRYVNKTGTNVWDSDAPGESYTLFPMPDPLEPPALYLGLDRAPGNTALTLYASVPARQALEYLPVVAPPTERGALPPPESTCPDPDPPADSGEGAVQIAWEYWNGRTWDSLTVADGSYGFTEPGEIQLLLPPDMAPLARFSTGERYWIRARYLGGPTQAFPVLSGLPTNTVRVVQVQTVAAEVLGSSTGRQEQVFPVIKPPVQPGQVLLVREPERPSTTDEQALVAEEGEGAVEERMGADGLPTFWVRWHEVANLRLSGPHSRHYSVDRAAGTIHFGDGVQGMVPPRGSGNLVLQQYQSGGGASGNQPAGAVTQLKTSLPYVQAVRNPDAMDGGSEPESDEEVRRRGPFTIKHRGRALTAEDLEWLAREAASTRVARAKVLSNRNRLLLPERGWVTVIVLPRGTEKRPLPATELIDTVEDYLAQRAGPDLAARSPSRINVIGPGYVPVSLAVNIQPTSTGEMEAVRSRVQAQLDRFLHPLTGGQYGTGWEFGRPVYLSELYAALEALDGVEYVPQIRFRPTCATLPLAFGDGAPELRTALCKGSRVARHDNSQVYGRLMDELPALSRPAGARVIHFREGELIWLVPPAETEAAQGLRLYIRSIDGTKLLVDPFVAATDFPVGTPVVTGDEGAASVLTEAVAAGQTVTTLLVQPLLDSAGDMVAIGASGLAFPVADFGTKLELGAHDLIYSGSHTIVFGEEGG